MALPGHRLRLRFRDGTEGTADLTGLITGADAGLFAALHGEAAFAAVCLELGVPTWPNGADVDPTWLYDEIRATGQWIAPFAVSDSPAMRAPFS